MKIKQIKDQVTNTNKVDQQTRSRFRIQIESLMIDLNEEIYAVREEVTRLLQISQLTTSQLNDDRRSEFEGRKVDLLTRVHELESSKVI